MIHVLLGHLLDCLCKIPALWAVTSGSSVPKSPCVRNASLFSQDLFSLGTRAKGHFTSAAKRVCVKFKVTCVKLRACL